MSDWGLDAIRVGPRARKSLGDLDALQRSIEEIGLLHPIVIRPDGTLIAGARRLEVFRRLGRATIPVHVLDLELVRRGEQDENVLRQAFTPSEWVAIKRANAKELQRAADDRRRAGARLGGLLRQGKNSLQKSLLKAERQVRDLLADGLGISWLTLDKAEVVVTAAEENPAAYGYLVELMDRTGKVDGAFKLLERTKKAADIQAEPLPLPTGPFRVIVADPPWLYANRGDDATHRAGSPYPEMTIPDICALPVGALAADDALLWLWTTNAHMRDAFAVLDAWEFSHKTILTWVKDRMGTGDWLRGQTEHCLLAVRGRPTVVLTNQTTVIQGPMREHSRKPDAFYELVEALCPGSKVELFARETRPGWQAWGAETARFDAI